MHQLMDVSPVFPVCIKNPLVTPFCWIWITKIKVSNMFCEQLSLYNVLPGHDFLAAYPTIRCIVAVPKVALNLPPALTAGQQ